MLKRRLIACLIVRDGWLVQSIGFEQYLPIGRADISVEFVSRWDVDEIVILDISADARDRGPDCELVSIASASCFVPLTVGGGITEIEQIRRIVRSGADKVAINTQALLTPDFITRAADAFGSQCIVVSIDARRGNAGYEVVQHPERRSAGRAPAEWAAEAEACGAGEILINSIDRDGSKLGYDLELVRGVSRAVSIPVIAVGGVGTFRHFAPGITDGEASAVAAANMFHYVEHSTILSKAHLVRAGVDVRLDSVAKYDNAEFDEHGRLLRLPSAELERQPFRRFVRREL